MSIWTIDSISWYFSCLRQYFGLQSIRLQGLELFIFTRRPISHNRLTSIPKYTAACKISPVALSSELHHLQYAESQVTIWNDLSSHVQNREVPVCCGGGTSWLTIRSSPVRRALRHCEQVAVVRAFLRGVVVEAGVVT
jgi:hypothetical protein